MAEAIHRFQRTQMAFAAYIRDPERAPIPCDVPRERMALYRELFFNNIENFIATGFPVLKSVLTDERWIGLVQDFFSVHRCRAPLFFEIAEEFLAYLQDERAPQEDDPPFLIELAHYEWVELRLAVMESNPPPVSGQLSVNPLSAKVWLSDLALPLAYRFPVHRIGPLFQPTQASQQPTYLLVYRGRDDDVRFMEINAVMFRMLEILKSEGAIVAGECLQRIADELEHPCPTEVLDFGADALRQLGDRGVVGAAA
jgi:hypothetical protein